MDVPESQEEDVTLTSYKKCGKREEHVEIRLTASRITFFVANGRTIRKKNNYADLSDKRSDSVKDVFVTRRYRNRGIEDGMHQVLSLLLRYFYIETLGISTNDDGDDIREQWLTVVADIFTRTGVRCDHIFANRIVPGMYHLASSMGCKHIALDSIVPKILVNTVLESISQGIETLIEMDLENLNSLQSVVTLLKKWEAKEVSFINVKVLGMDYKRALTDKILADSIISSLNSTVLETKTTIYDIDSVEETRSTRTMIERPADKMIIFVTLLFMPEYTLIEIREPHR